MCPASWAVICALMAVTLLPGSLASTPPTFHPFAANLGPTRPVLVTGTVRTDASAAGDGLAFSELLDLGPGDRLELSGSRRTVVRVFERHWTTLNASGPRVDWEGRAPRDYVEAGTAVVTHAGAWLAFNAQSRVYVQSTAGAEQGSVDFPAGAICEVRPKDPNLRSPPEHEPVTEAWEAAVVFAECRSQSLRLVGSVLSVFDARVSVTVPGEEGTSRSWEAGTFHARNSSMLDATDHTARYIQLQADGDAIVSFAEAATVSFYAPRLLVVGELRISSRAGDIVWGSQRLAGPVDDLRPAGTFAVAAPDSSTLTLDGATTNGPPAPDVLDLRYVAGSAVAVTAALAFLAFFAKRLILALAGFTRISRNRLLDHPLRQRILLAVEANPGIGIQALCDLLQAARSVVVHHVRVLSTNGLVEVRHETRRTAITMRGTPAPSITQARALQNPNVRALLAEITREGVQTHRQLAKRTGLDRSSVTKLLARLERWGLVRADGTGPRRAYSVLIQPESD